MRREKEELLFKRKAEMESRMADLQRAYEEKLLEKKAAEYENLKR